MKSKIYLSSPHLSVNEVHFVKNSIYAEELIFGENISFFQKKLEFFLESKKKIVALSSGTAAIHIGLILAGVTSKDEVLCQTFTYIASANPICYLGANPVFVGSESTTWNMCPLALEEAIVDRIAKGKKPKVIIVVHSYGMPAKIFEIQAIAQKYDIALIEDAAEALGSSYKGQKCGTFGDFGVLSFNGNKIITTSGGGALICRDTQTKEKAIFLATQARDEAPHYQHSEIGYNYRMSNIVAGIGRGQMQVLDKHIGLRRKMHDFYSNIFKDVRGVRVFTEPNADYFSNHWLSCILIDEKTAGFSREDVRIAFQEANIESRPLWKPMHLQPVFKNTPFYGAGVAEKLFEEGLCLPSGSNLTDADRQRIQQGLLKFI